MAGDTGLNVFWTDLQRLSADPGAVESLPVRRARAVLKAWQGCARQLDTAAHRLTYARREPIADPEHWAEIIGATDSWWFLRLSVVLHGQQVFESVLADPTLLPADKQVEDLWPEELLGALEDRVPGLDGPKLLVVDGDWVDVSVNKTWDCFESNLKFPARYVEEYRRVFSVLNASEAHRKWWSGINDECLLVFVAFAADGERLTRRARFVGRDPEVSLRVRASAAIGLELSDMVHLARVQVRDALLALSAKADLPVPPEFPAKIWRAPRAMKDVGASWRG